MLRPLGRVRGLLGWHGWPFLLATLAALMLGFFPR